MNKPLDKQIGGSHYKRFKIQPIQFILSNSIPFCEGNIIKYICRHRFKNGIEDLNKVGHYVEILTEFYNKPKKIEREIERGNVGDNEMFMGFKDISLKQRWNENSIDCKAFCELNNLGELETNIIYLICEFIQDYCHIKLLNDIIYNLKKLKETYTKEK